MAIANFVFFFLSFFRYQSTYTYLSIFRLICSRAHTWLRNIACVCECEWWLRTRALISTLLVKVTCAWMGLQNYTWRKTQCNLCMHSTQSHCSFKAVVITGICKSRSNLYNPLRRLFFYMPRDCIVMNCNIVISPLHQLLAVMAKSVTVNLITVRLLIQIYILREK